MAGLSSKEKEKTAGTNMTIYIFHIFVCVCIYILQMKCAEKVIQLKRDSTLCQNIDMERLLNLLIYYCFPKQE